MSHERRFFIDGEWSPPSTGQWIEVINPATEEPLGSVGAGNQADVDRAVNAARSAFPAFSQTSRDERIALLERIADIYAARSEEMAHTVTEEMGAPLQLARSAQVATGLAHLRKAIEVLRNFDFCMVRGRTHIVKEPIGVCGLITPWNWPLNQIASKVAPALAAGCTVVLKPSEVAPLNASLFAEILEEAGTPRGVFNLVHGTGADVGHCIASHRDVDMISFTGSTRTGALVAKAAADTIKRVHQELGGKSANVILPGADLTEAVTRGVASCFRNSGQSCNSPTRMFVPRESLSEAIELAVSVASASRVGSPRAPDTVLGPVASEPQFRRVQNYITSAIEDRVPLVAGGPGRPAGFARGFYVRPTIFAPVDPHMTIAREEIFGPVLCILPYDDQQELIALVNNSVYGLAAYVHGRNLTDIYKVATQLRVGTVNLNYAPWDPGAPFGGYKQSGNGREYGEFGLEAFLELKSIVGHDEMIAPARETSSTTRD
jgi:aldehyde dehydrogenase (NAD+)